MRRPIGVLVCFFTLAAAALAGSACTDTPPPSSASAASPDAQAPDEPGEHDSQDEYVEGPLAPDDEDLYDPPLASAGRDLVDDSELETNGNPALAASFATIAAHGAHPVIDTDPARFAELAVLRVLNDIPAAEVQHAPTGGAFIEHDTGARRIIVSTGGALPPEPLGPDDVLVRATSADLGDVRIEQRFERAPSAAGGSTNTRLAQVVVETRSGERLGLANVGAPSAAPSSRDCIAEAWAMAPALPPMTVVNPEVRGCNIDQCVKVRRAWLVAQHDLMRAYQMLEFIGESPEEERAFLWSQRGVGLDPVTKQPKMLGPETSAEHWFGPYARYRFDAIRQGVRKLYTSFREGKHYSSGATIKLICPQYDDNPGNICFTKKPSAHHAVAGFVNFCDRFFTEKDAWQEGRLMSHEVLHHTWVTWKNTIGRLDPIQDTHYHGHGPGCGLSPITSPQYGPDRIEHLATYTNGNGNDCRHRDINFRNNDTYAYFVRTIGNAVLTRAMTSWPAEPPPKQQSGGGTNNPPEGCNGGEWNPPPPGGDWQDPSSGCQKQGGELVCPSGSGGGGSFGGVPKQLQDLKIECPPEL